MEMIIAIIGSLILGIMIGLYPRTEKVFWLKEEEFVYTEVNGRQHVMRISRYEDRAILEYSVNADPVFYTISWRDDYE